jgi:hypothetical protein
MEVLPNRGLREDFRQLIPGQQCFFLNENALAEFLRLQLFTALDIAVHLDCLEQLPVLL